MLVSPIIETTKNSNYKIKIHFRVNSIVFKKKKKIILTTKEN